MSVCVIALVLGIWEVPGSNLSLKTGYPEGLFFSSFASDKRQDSTIIRSGPLLSIFLPFHCSLIILTFKMISLKLPRNVVHCHIKMPQYYNALNCENILGILSSFICVPTGQIMFESNSGMQ
jgi:hypothetical protein